MRVLFTSTSGLGHFYPLLPLMRAARAAGDEVLVAISPAGVPSAVAQGFRAVGTAAPHSASQRRVLGRAAAGDRAQHVRAQRAVRRLYAEASMPVITEIVTDFRPDLIVSEVAEFAGQVVAAQARHPPRHGRDRLDGPARPDAQRARRARSTACGSAPASRRSASCRGRPTTPGSSPPVPRVLWMSPDDVPANTVVYRHEDPEGTVPVARAVGDEPGRRPTVYATLGSVAGAMPFATQAFGGVLAGLGQVDADVLFTVGSTRPHDRSGRSRPTCTSRSYVPQQVAMCCDAVVAHAGCGTTVAALSRGLPIVAVPLFADQMHNAERITTAGAGLTVDARSAVRSWHRRARGARQPVVSAAARRRSRPNDRGLPPAADVLAQLRPAEVH